MLVMRPLLSSSWTWPIAQAQLMLMMHTLLSASATWPFAQGQVMLMMRASPHLGLGFFAQGQLMLMMRARLSLSGTWLSAQGQLMLIASAADAHGAYSSFDPGFGPPHKQLMFIALSLSLPPS